LVTIAVAYASDQIAKDELYSMRDKLYAEAGIVGGKRLSKKTADASAKSAAPATKKAKAEDAEDAELSPAQMPQKGSRVKPRAKADLATAAGANNAKTTPPTAMASPMFSSDEE
jgi:hypothetical protein